MGVWPKFVKSYKINKQHPRATIERIGELSDKLIALDRLVDALSGSLQKISNECHVGFTRAEQKHEKLSGSITSDMGSLRTQVNNMIPMLRECRANISEKLVPASSALAQEADGIRGRIDDLPVDNIMRYLGNTESEVLQVKESVDQVWSWLSDITRNIQDINGRVQELDDKVTERLPKLPPRKPPTQTGATSTGTNTDVQQHPPETIRLQETIPAPLYVSAAAPAPQLAPQLWPLRRPLVCGKRSQRQGLPLPRGRMVPRRGAQAKNESTYLQVMAPALTLHD